MELELPTTLLAIATLANEQDRPVSIMEQALSDLMFDLAMSPALSSRAIWSKDMARPKALS